MERKKVLILIVGILHFLFVSSCGSQPPEGSKGMETGLLENDSPTSTLSADITSSATPTAAQSSTPTATITETQTALPTPSYTPTPLPLLMDNINQAVGRVNYSIPVMEMLQLENIDLEYLDVKLSPDGQFLASIVCAGKAGMKNCRYDTVEEMSDTYLFLQELESGEIVEQAAFRSGKDKKILTTVWFSPDSNQILYTVLPRQVILRQIENQGQEMMVISDGKIPHSQDININRMLLADSFDGLTTLYNLQNGQIVHTLEGAYSARFSPAGNRLFAYSTNKRETVNVYSTDNWQPVASVNLGQKLGVLAYTPGGERIIVYGLDEGIEIWDVEMGEKLVSLYPPLTGLYGLAMNADGSLLFLNGNPHRDRPYESTVVYDMRSFQQVAILYDLTIGRRFTDFTPDNQAFTALSYASINLFTLPGYAEIEMMDRVKQFMQALEDENYSLAAKLFLPDETLPEFFGIEDNELNGPEEIYQFICESEFGACFSVAEVVSMRRLPWGDLLMLLRLQAPDGGYVTGYFGEIFPFSLSTPNLEEARVLELPSR